MDKGRIIVKITNGKRNAWLKIKEYNKERMEGMK
jgi:hypothetical protein